MQNKIKLSVLFVLVISLFMVPCIAGAKSLDQIISDGKITVGVNPSYPPAALYNDKNELDGFDVDIAKKLAELLKVKAEFVAVNPNDRIPFLTSGKIDICLGFLTRTTERAKLIDFSVPLNTEALGVLTTQDQPYKSWKDMNTEKVTFVEVRGTTGVTFIKNNLPKAKVLLLDNHPDVIRAVAQGRGNAVIDIIDFLGIQMKKYENVKWKILPEPCGPVDYCGIGVAKGDDTLRLWLNVALFDLHQSGFVNEIWKKWFGIEMAFSVKPQPFF